MRNRFAAALLLGFAANAATAQEITLEADKILWCGSAFFWLATSADDSGDNREARQYLAWSEQLMARGVALLKADQLDAAAIAHVVEAYDNAVVAELGTEKSRHDVTTCPALVLPEPAPPPGPKAAPSP